LLLAAALLVPMQALSSTCLKETAPEVIPVLVTGDRETVSEAIEALDPLAEQPDASLAAPWLAAQASMQFDIGSVDEAIARLRRSIPGWVENGNVAAEVCARHLLVFGLTLRSESRPALSETLLAEARARQAGLAEALDRLRRTRITLMLTLNERLEEALLLMNEIRPGESAAERANGRHVRGLMLDRLNRHRQAARQFEQVIELAGEAGLDEMVAAARLNLANQLARFGRDDPTAVPEQRVVDLLEAVVEDPAARAATRAVALRTLSLYQPPEARDALLTECEREAERARDDRRRAVCMADRAELLVDHDSIRALALMAEAVALTEDEPRARWQIQPQRLALIWATEPPDEAFRSSLDAIGAEQQLLDLQMEGPDRAVLIDGLSWDYRRLADRAYRHTETHPELALAAFDLLAANQARVLREQRRINRSAEEDEMVRRLADAINVLQQQLLSLDTTPNRIEDARAELRRLEAAWHQAVLRPPVASEALPPTPGIERIRAALRSDEALLSFLTLVPGQHDRTHGWLHVLTADGSRVYEVPGAAVLDDANALMTGLADGPGAGGVLDRLGSALFGAALADLPARIDHLIVIPDRGLDALPLERLPGADGRSLGLRYSVDLVPSAGVWFGARQSGRSGRRVLAMADPVLPEHGYAALDEAYPDRAPPELPGALAEVERIADIAGSRHVRVQTGPSASENALRGFLEHEQAVLIHFATHALIHPDDHDRSAILLAADEGSDGLLQPREIERLGLDGVSVVLASCASATGERLDNEGVISLARSFLAAGAPSVVATRWPVDDRSAQAFFQRFYWHLANGSDQSSAMRLARGDLHTTGHPESAWSAWVLIGDGRWQPLPERTAWVAWAALIIAVVLILVLFVRIR